MTNEQGNLAINSENIFPIIKKWLYSDHDIFIREVVSNACDAITKLKKLDLMSETSLPDDYKAKIEVEVNPEDKTITFTDNGLGMTADEVKEYINQIAFSGAADFLEKYKDKANEEQIIGHFGLGFYSVFMVADSAEIHTLSYKEGSEAVHWESDGGLTFEMELTAQLLRAGFAAESAARLVNVALGLKGAEQEAGATLDLLTVDLYTGRAGLFKAGAAPSFLVRGGVPRMLDGASLPMGVLDSLVGRSTTFALDAGDWVVLVSDGALTDGSDWLMQQLQLCAKLGHTPKQAAETVADAAARRAGAKQDDITVAVLAMGRA